MRRRRLVISPTRRRLVEWAAPAADQTRHKPHASRTQAPAERASPTRGLAVKRARSAHLARASRRATNAGTKEHPTRASRRQLQIANHQAPIANVDSAAAASQPHSNYRRPTRRRPESAFQYESVRPLVHQERLVAKPAPLVAPDWSNRQELIDRCTSAPNPRRRMDEFRFDRKDRFVRRAIQPDGSHRPVSARRAV